MEVPSIVAHVAITIVKPTPRVKWHVRYCIKPDPDVKMLCSMVHTSENESEVVRHNPNVAVARAIGILECFSEQEPELSLSELARRVGVNPGTAHRLVADLLIAGYLAKDERHGAYRLGLKVIGLAKVAINTQPIRAEAMGFLERLAVETGANVSLGVLDGTDVVYLARVPSPHAADPYFHAGRRIPAHCSSLGKVLLAYRHRDELTDHLPESLTKYTENTVVSRSQLLEELQEVKATGVATDRGEYMAGTHCIGAPIFDSGRNVVAAVSLSNTHTFLAPAEVESLATNLLRTCGHVSQRLGLGLYVPNARP